MSFGVLGKIMLTPKMIGLLHSSDGIEIHHASYAPRISMWGHGIADS